ncbi:Short C-terminal domain-containing protein [Alteromonadaceae bacterium Bs31]|nr:Short C-terminal domain-containing protein [Alteromonadaceae bacterium Bs31]
MGPGRFFESGMWVFPCMMFCIMLLVAFVLIKRYGGIQQALDVVFTRLPEQPKMNQLEQNTQGESPLDIIKLRYASGEISKEQYEAMKKELA